LQLVPRFELFGGIVTDFSAQPCVDDYGLCMAHARCEQQYGASAGDVMESLTKLVLHKVILSK
jgi:hypothetical protein